jgi:hypothetical protein
LGARESSERSPNIIITVGVVLLFLAVVGTWVFLTHRQAIVLPNNQPEIISLLKQEGIEYSASRTGQMGYVEWSIVFPKKPKDFSRKVREALQLTRSLILRAGLRITEEIQFDSINFERDFSYYCIYESLRTKGTVTLSFYSVGQSGGVLIFVGSGDIAIQ